MSTTPYKPMPLKDLIEVFSKRCARYEVQRRPDIYHECQSVLISLRELEALREKSGG